MEIVATTAVENWLKVDKQENKEHIQYKKQMRKISVC